ncbi:MAG: hypothetical protein JKY33_09585 [Bacteroidia bacterium]|nr:hypothetical protein [Bacteroidia bacterium]
MKKAALTAFLDIENLLDRENGSTREFHERTGVYKPTSLGILPTIGLRFDF